MQQNNELMRITEDEFGQLQLQPGQRKVIRQRSGLDGEVIARADIARRYGIPRSHVRAIELRALDALRMLRSQTGPKAE